LIVLKFLDEYEPTKVDSYRKHVTLAGEQVMLDIVDTAGQDDYTAARDHYLYSADAYLCVFSLSEPESLQDIIDLRWDITLYTHDLIQILSYYLWQHPSHEPSELLQCTG